MKEAARNSNMELLRIVSMLMVLSLHYLLFGNVLSLSTVGGAAYYACWTVEAVCHISVDCYMLISGYFLSGAEYRIKRILIVIAEVFFYTIGVTAVMLLTSSAHITATDSVYKAIQFLLPFLQTTAACLFQLLAQAVQGLAGVFPQPFRMGEHPFFLEFLQGPAAVLEPAFHGPFQAPDQLGQAFPVSAPFWHSQFCCCRWGRSPEIRRKIAEGEVDFMAHRRDHRDL